MGWGEGWSEDGDGERDGMGIGWGWDGVGMEMVRGQGGRQGSPENGLRAFS